MYSLICQEASQYKSVEGKHKSLYKKIQMTKNEIQIKNTKITSTKGTMDQEGARLLTYSTIGLQ